MHKISKDARLSGFLYLLMGPFAAFSVLYLRSVLFVSEDATATANNILASEGLFRLGIISTFIYQIIFMCLVLFLYNLFKCVNRNIALLMLTLVLVSIPIVCLNELNQFAVLSLLSNDEYLAVFDIKQLYAQAQFFYDLHERGILIAQVFWGLWLLPLGMLVYKSNFVPKVIGVLLVIAGIGYLFDCITLILVPDWGVVISMFTFFGEPIFALWLLIKDINSEKWEKYNTLPVKGG